VTNQPEDFLVNDPSTRRLPDRCDLNSEELLSHELRFTIEPLLRNRKIRLVQSFLWIRACELWGKFEDEQYYQNAAGVSCKGDYWRAIHGISSFQQACFSESTYARLHVAGGALATRDSIRVWSGPQQF